ncbi:hypothetical protein GCM10022233_55490 [Streptomyces shaanxiensis]|uniref:Uncharacterized protein n=1 Tax=Streptomyces shaanxiensis TaxID=653357 RepID=A0ABP7VP61_9ACTN
MATELGAHDGQWLTLADQSRATRPADALAVYRRLTEPLTRQADNVYEQLVSLPVSMRDCHRHLDTPDDFTTYITALRTRPEAHGWWTNRGYELRRSPTCVTVPLGSFCPLSRAYDRSGWWRIVVRPCLLRAQMNHVCNSVAVLVELTEGMPTTATSTP